MAGREAMDQQRLILALAGAVVREIGQAVEGEPRFGPLSGLRLQPVQTLARLGLRRRHGGGGERCHGDGDAVGQRQLVRFGFLLE